MRKFMANARSRFWECVELWLRRHSRGHADRPHPRQGSGVFVLSVADNVTKFASAVPTPSLIGLALVLGVIYLIMNRANRAR